MDLSNYNVDSEVYDPTNKKVLGMMKDEAAGYAITEFVALKPKMYIYDKIKIEGGELKSEVRAKGVNTCNAKKILTEDFKKILFGESLKRVETCRSIKSINQQIFSIQQTKIGLTNSDNKRYYLSNLVSRPYGHWRDKKKYFT